MRLEAQCQRLINEIVSALGLVLSLMMRFALQSWTDHPQYKKGERVLVGPTTVSASAVPGSVPGTIPSS